MVMFTPARARRSVGLIVLVLALAFSAHTQIPASTSAKPEERVVLDKLLTQDSGFYPNHVVQKTPTHPAAGFSRKLEDTAVALSTFPTACWGIAGAAQVRGLSAALNLRGITRTDPQGMVYTAITPRDAMEEASDFPVVHHNGYFVGYINNLSKFTRDAPRNNFGHDRDTVLLTSVVDFRNNTRAVKLGDLIGTADFFLHPSQRKDGTRDQTLTAIEEQVNDHTFMGCIDMIEDVDPDTMVKNWLLDHAQESKPPQLSFNQLEEIAVTEDELTIRRRKERLLLLNKLPPWLGVERLASATVRSTEAEGISTSSDFDDRRDLVTGNLPTDTFASFITRGGNHSGATGERISTSTFSRPSATDVGLVFDLQRWKGSRVQSCIRTIYSSANSRSDGCYNRDESSRRANVAQAQSLRARRRLVSSDQIAIGRMPI